MLRFLTNYFFGILLLGFLALLTNAYAVGLMPTPVLYNAKISSDISFDQAYRRYNYTYAVTNPAGNTGEIWHFTIDVSHAGENGMKNQTYGLTIPFGRTVDFSSMLSDLVSMNNARPIPTALQAAAIVPFGQIVSQGWVGALGLDSYAHFISGDNAPNIVPGTSLGGFQMISYGVPTIRKAQIIPLWMHIVDDHDAVPDADRIEAGKIEQNIIFNTLTLGPSGVSYGSYAHWNQLRDDLAQAIQLGWISDNNLARNLTTQLAYARQALDAHDLYTTKVRLPALLDTINNSTPTQRTSEGYGLVALNVQSLIDNTGDNQIEPKITLSPKTADLSIGRQQTLSVTLIDLANGSRPLADIQVRFRVDSGPNAGDLGMVITDAHGKAAITYTGLQVGADKVIASARFYGGEVTYDDAGVVLWAGGPDLVVPLFSPPLLVTKGGRKFYMSEETQNIGNVMARPSVTRYYISATPMLDITTAQVIGERTIPALQPGKSDSINHRVFHIPGNLLAGTYYLAACSDANNVIVEMNETNNCSFSKLEGRQSFIVPVKKSKAANEKDEDEDCKDEDDNHHDDRDSGKNNDSWFKNPFGKPEVKRIDERDSSKNNDHWYKNIFGKPKEDR